MAAFQQDSGAHHREIEDLLEGEWSLPARRAGVEPVIHLVDDDPVDAVVGVADDHGADAIVTGVHGSSGRGFHFVGGVTRRFLRHASVPVVVARDPVPDTTAKVLACIGYGRVTDEALEWAATYAEATGRPLELLHVVSDRPIYPLDSPVDMLGSFLGPGVDLAWAAEDLEATGQALAADHPHLAITTRVAHGSVVPSILEAAEGADLVVVGKPHGGTLTRVVVSPRLYQLLARSVSSTAIVPSCEPDTQPPS
jgi:nucleotide-binding universal stress UspA family protein